MQQTDGKTNTALYYNIDETAYSHFSRNLSMSYLWARSKKLRGERKAETNASTLVGVTSHVTISAKIHCK